ncbi:MAG: ABC transporter permease [Thaumarchaeota archaeon]|nr:ABC transporter permease [Nitrososphaerota archaeon]
MVQPAELMRLSYDALRERKVRSFLTVLMVLVGAALIVALSGLSAGFSGFIDKQFSLLSPNVLIITPSEAFGPQTQPSTRTDLDNRVIRNIEKVLGVESVVPVIQQAVTLRTGSGSKTVTLIGMDQTKMKFVFPTFELEEGNPIYEYDISGIILGNEVKYPPGSASPLATLGQSVTLEYSRPVTEGGSTKTIVERKSLLVRGSVVNLGTGLFIPLDRSIATSLKAADSIFQKGGKYDIILVITKSPSANQQVEDGIRRIYGKNIGVSTPKVLTSTIQTFVSGFTVFVLGIASVSLLVAAVGIVTTLITSVMERTREIGLLKALGFKKNHIMLLFLFEASIIGVIGASLGLVAGLGLGTFVLPAFTPTGAPGVSQIQPSFLPSDLLSVWLFSVFVSAGAGFYPAWRASRLDPVVALRKEL